MSSDTTTALTPKLQDVTITWKGGTEIVDIRATFLKSPTSGIYEMLIDGQPLITAITAELQIYKDARGTGGTRRLTSGLTTEGSRPKARGWLLRGAVVR